MQSDSFTPDPFRYILQAHSMLPDAVRAYDALSQVFYRALDHRLREQSITFSGTFAKVDYLLKEAAAPTDLVLAVNDSRVRFRKRTSMTQEEISAVFMQDLTAVSKFICLIYNVKAPVELERLYVERTPRPQSSTKLAPYIRASVSRVGAHAIYCRCDDYLAGKEVMVTYGSGTSVIGGEYGYLREMLSEGMQINIIRPTLRTDGALVPEIIILDPDNLINVSTIAACFTNYAEGWMVDLVRKILPQEITEPIVLGNFAGQLLDEEIHQVSGSRTYSQSITEYFRKNALSLLNIDISPDFHNEAKRQKANIHKSINTDLARAVGEFDSRNGIVEPSFFCEMLGLQGRMDFLQLDHKVLIEQKSGKASYSRDMSATPVFKEEHYVQLLLYMLVLKYNFSKQYEKNRRRLHAFLMYSKYTDSLVSLGFSPQLTSRVFRVRNEIAWAFRRYARDGGFDILLSLTSDKVNKKGIRNKLWTLYQCPKIEAALSPIQSASPLEKAYYLRFMTFLANEHLMSKTGTVMKEGTGFASTWHDTLDDKLRSGNIYHNLRLVSPAFGCTTPVDEVTLAFGSGDTAESANFRVGDVVILYPYHPGTEPDARASMVVRASIRSISPDSIILRLRATQADSRLFDHEAENVWAVEHDLIEASFDWQYRAMHKLLTAPQHRRDLLLLQRPPCVDDTLCLKGDYGPFNELMLRVKRARDLFLIIGPPGTGKTSFGMLNTLKEELLEAGSSVLVVSYTNRAVDEICSKLVEEGIEFIRLGSELSCAPQFRSHLVGQLVSGTPKLDILKQKIHSARVFVGTTSSVNTSLHLLSAKKFSLAIVDEASQILEPQLIGILAATYSGEPAVKKVVMIGDHKQLPAVVLQSPAISAVDDEALHRIGLVDCGLSLFERLLSRYAHDPQVTYMLCRQGRMHREIAEFPNLAFYDNCLTEVPLPHQIAQLPDACAKTSLEQILRRHRVAFISVTPSAEDVSDKVNQTEADIIAALVKDIYMIEGRDFSATTTVGVIVPYRNQISTVRKSLQAFGIAGLQDVTVDTVERFQGSQREYIIYGFTVKKSYQLEFLSANVFTDDKGCLIDRKLNVAMTRARRHLIMLGYARLLSGDPVFSRLMNYLKDKNSYFDSSTFHDM